MNFGGEIKLLGSGRVYRVRRSMSEGGEYRS